MSKSNSLLLEYENITKEIESIRNKISILKEITENKLKNTTNEKEKLNIFADFKLQIQKIKNDKHIKQKYKTLQLKKSDIEKKINDSLKSDNSIDCDDTEIFVKNTLNDKKYNISTELLVLINKYKKSVDSTISEKADTVFNKKIKLNKKTNNTNNTNQIKKLSNLIESLKMDISE